MTRYKKEKNKLQNYGSAQNNHTVNHSIQSSSNENHALTTEENVDTTSTVAISETNPPSTSESNISESLLTVTLNTLSKQVKEISDFLPEIAKRSDLKQLIDSTSGQGKIISENLVGKLDSKAQEVNLRFTSLDTLTKNVDRKIDGVLRKKDFDFAETRLSDKIQRAEDSARRNIRLDMERGLQALLSELQSKISRDSNSATNSVNNSVNSAAQKILNSQRNSNEALTQQLNDVEGKLKYIGEQTELIQSLPGKIDGLTDILSAKGLQIKQEFPVLNHDEETLAQLAQCGEKILQQLTIAARWYARKKPELDKHETAIKNLNETHEKELIRAAKDGEARGRKAAVQALLARYGENIPDLMESAEKGSGRLNVLAEFLKNEGVEQIYQLHEELEITDDNLMNYEHNIANLRAGKIIITSPGYSFDNQVVSKATYMPADDFFATQVAGQPVEEYSADDMPTEKTAADSQAEENSVDTNEELSSATKQVAPNETISAEG